MREVFSSGLQEERNGTARPFSLSPSRPASPSSARAVR